MSIRVKAALLSMRTGLSARNAGRALFTAWATPLLWLAAVSAPVHAAGPMLLSPLPEARASDVNAVQSRRIERIKARPTTAAVTLVHVNTAALGADSASIALPGAAALDFAKTAIEVRSASDYTWHGAVAGSGDQATIVVHDGNTTGSIRWSGRLYRIEPLGNGMHALIQVDTSRLPPEEPPSPDLPRSGGDAGAVYTGSLDASLNDAPTSIDVLVAYTPAAAAAVADIHGLIQLAVAETNQSYQNSFINIRMNLVDSFEIDYSEAGKSFNAVLADFAAMPDVNTRRNSSGADVAVVIADQPDYCGMAYQMDPVSTAFAGYAFAEVYYDCATGYYSFGHEIGHVQGARHDEAHEPTATPYAYGHGYEHPAPTASQSFRTIMAYACIVPLVCEPRVQYWSNPNVNYYGVPMGTAATNDNARVLNQTAATVASFRNAVPLPTFDRHMSAALSRFATGGSYPNDVKAADFDRSGTLDLIVADRDSSDLLLLSNSTVAGAATPSFNPLFRIPTMSQPWSVAVADINGDGVPDAISASYNSCSIEVFIHVRSGFLQAAPIPTGCFPWFVAVADINGDGKPDLITSNYYDNTVSVLLNTTPQGAQTPSFAPAQAFATGARPKQIVAADINGDGLPDLALADHDGADATVLLNTTPHGAATASFSGPFLFATGPQPWAITAVDYNGDARPDLVVTNQGNNTISILRNTTPIGAATPSFAAQQSVAVGSVPRSVTAADVNGDRWPDLIVDCQGAGRTYLLLNTTPPGGTSFSYVLPIRATAPSFSLFLSTGSSPASVIAADINNDGKPEVIVANALSNDVGVVTLTASP